MQSALAGVTSGDDVDPNTVLTQQAVGGGAAVRLRRTGGCTMILLGSSGVSGSRTSKPMLPSRCAQQPTRSRRPGWVGCGGRVTGRLSGLQLHLNHALSSRPCSESNGNLMLPLSAPCTTVYVPAGGEGMEQVALTRCMQSLLQSPPRFSTTAWLVIVISSPEMTAAQLPFFVVAQLEEKQVSNVTLTSSVASPGVRQTLPSLSKTNSVVSLHPEMRLMNRQQTYARMAGPWT